MTQRDSFYRKIVYLVGILLLAVAMISISEPATGGRKDSGGLLADLRHEYGIGQANLGDVDPASETMRFLTFGLRGVAVTALWNKTDHYKKTEDWTNLTATLEQLAKLQPNFLTFWVYQSWNLTYNVSVQFDDYHDRYYYVIRGMRFLQEGLRYNEGSPRLLSEMGWFIGHKIGRADEYLQYRRLFKADDDFHPADRPPDERDNWIVSKDWYQAAVDAFEKGKSLGNKSQRDLYSNPPKSQMSYAEAIEEEGQFEKAQRAWSIGGQEWKAFGQQPIEHSSGVLMRLGEEPRLTEARDKLRAELDALGPDARAALRTEKRQRLTPAELKILDTPRTEMTPEQNDQYYVLEPRVIVTDRDVALRIGRDRPESAEEALRVVRELEQAEQLLSYVVNYKHTTNYDYWQLRCDFEQSASALAAREKMFLAQRAKREANVVLAKQLYEEGFAKWRLAIDEFPKIMDDDVVIGNDLIDFTKQYRVVLEQMGQTLGESYPLWDALEKFDTERAFSEDLARHRKE